MVLLEDPPLSQVLLPFFNGFKSFFPPVRKPRVAATVHHASPPDFSVLPRIRRVDDVFARDVSSHEPLFNTNFHFFRLINAYWTNTRDD